MTEAECATRLRSACPLVVSSLSVPRSRRAGNRAGSPGPVPVDRSELRLRGNTGTGSGPYVEMGYAEYPVGEVSAPALGEWGIAILVLVLAAGAVRRARRAEAA